MLLHLAWLEALAIGGQRCISAVELGTHCHVECSYRGCPHAQVRAIAPEVENEVTPAASHSAFVAQR